MKPHHVSHPLPSTLFLALATLVPAVYAADEVIDGGSTVSVPGSQSSPWDIDGALIVGDSGTGTLSIGAGGVVNSVDGFLGNTLSTSNGTVTVSGSGATWNVTRGGTLGDIGLMVGRVGNGELVVSNGGAVNLGLANTTLGSVEGAVGKLTVTGAGSSFVTAGTIRIGLGAGTLEVLDGATVSADRGVKADSFGSGHFTVSGPGSLLTTGTAAHIDLRTVTDGGSSLTISNGGKVETTSNVNIGNFSNLLTQTPGNVVASVNGAGSSLKVGNVTIQKGTLDIEAGAVVTTSGPSHIARDRDQNGSVRISGEGSSWTATNDGTGPINGDFLVGSQTGSTGTLTLSDGGAFTHQTSSGALKAIGLGSLSAGQGTLNIGEGGKAGHLYASEVKSGTNVNSNAVVNFNHTDDITFSPNITGTRMSVTKEGSGTTTLTGANTYSQATTVNEGALLVHGSLGATVVTVSSGATFGGNGVHTGTISLQGTVSPGASTGTFTTGAATFAGGAGYFWELGDAAGEAGSGWDLLDITGTLAFSATEADPFLLTLAKAGDLFGFDPSQDHDFVIATAGSISGFSADAFTIDAAGIPESLPGLWSVAQDDNSLVLSYTAAIPEPSSAAFGALGLLTLLRRRR